MCEGVLTVLRIPGVGGRRPCADVRRHRWHIHRRRDTAAVQGSVRVVSVPRKRFERKGRFAGMLAKIPTCLILEESPALLGLAHLPLAGWKHLSFMWQHIL